MHQISASILWTTLRSLKIAMSFKSTGFENLDVVSSELVKFLLVNTGYESISKLEAQVAALEANKKEMASSLKGANTAATTASNKVDDLKKVVASLEKRVKK